MTSIYATDATEPDHKSKPLMGDENGYPLNQQLGQRYVTHDASGTPTTKYPIQLLNGTSGALTMTFPPSLVNYVGQDITFVGIGTARQHVITGTAGWLNGSDSITMPATGGAVTIHVYTPTLAVVKSTDGIGVYTIA